MLKKIGLFLFIFVNIAQALPDQDCIDWFKLSGLKPEAKGCILSCQALPTDMSTFYCPNQCESLCSSRACQEDPYWKSTIKPGKPSGWKLTGEKSSDWSGDEKKQLLSILNQLPEDIKKIPFDGFYRMQKSINIINPATTSDSGNVIVIYDRCFKNPFWSVSDVILHELGHMVFLNMTEKEKRDFKNQMGWKSSFRGDSSRSGDFISSRAKDSPDEDFAESFSFFLSEPVALKSKVPKAYDWLIRKFSANFKLKKDCLHEK